ncbi:uncharacterized protein METZ01_LOCUS351588 [marine metagenome]|uniref:Uncharacterized protein n=1 Tax=marine metagenome TaxID=408172 RepID=A0A382RM06_9ZZZZ
MDLFPSSEPHPAALRETKPTPSVDLRTLHVI